MGTHKIQSSSEGVDLHLDPVPKLLKSVRVWSPHSFVVSFKLETDPNLVLMKARLAIEKYGVHLVIANQLQVTLANLLTYSVLSEVHCLLLICLSVC